MPSALGPVPDVCAPEKKKEFLYLSLKKFSLRLTEEKTEFSLVCQPEEHISNTELSSVSLSLHYAAVRIFNC